ncbi:hypothetical protein ACI65C_011842 [Semiaphis heraclei]
MADVQMDIYEDMFKEITKKIYGQDTSSSEDRQFSGQDAYKMVEEGLSMIDNDEAESFGEQSQPEDDPWVTSEETIAWTASKIGSYNVDKKLFKCQECDSMGLLSSVAEHWLGTHADVKVFQCPQCPYASAYTKCIRLHLARQHNVVAEHGTHQQAGRKSWKESPVLEEVTSYLGRLKAAADKAIAAAAAAAAAAAIAASAESEAADDEMQLNAADTETQTAQKRFNCVHCPYATDRRDLYTRHENIHKEDKPFQCDICQKQFNRADHVKKHYTRMHREHEYCLSRVKRDPFGKSAAVMAAYHHQQQLQRVTLYSDDPPSMEPETQIIVSRTIDELPLPPPAVPIIEANNSLVLDDQQQQQQQQHTVVNIAVVNFNEQTGTHTIQIPIPVNQIKPVMFAPDAILAVEPVVPTSTATISKPKGKGSRKNFEKRYCCTFCPWSGVDNWCLKRHLNTHMKPYECVFCEYKAARAERLATHVFKVHSKRMCCRCSYIAQDQDDLYAHQSENNHKSVRSRRTQTSPIPSSPEQSEETITDKNDVIVVWPMAGMTDSQNSIQI